MDPPKCCTDENSVYVTAITTEILSGTLVSPSPNIGRTCLFCTIGIDTHAYFCALRSPLRSRSATLSTLLRSHALVVTFLKWHLVDVTCVPRWDIGLQYNADHLQTTDALCGWSSSRWYASGDVIAEPLSPVTLLDATRWRFPAAPCNATS